MTTVYEELHTLIDKLPEEAAERLVKQLREEVGESAENITRWHDEMRPLREKLAQYAPFQSAADILNELRSSAAG